MDTPWGHLWLAREVALVVAAGAVWSWATRRPRSVGRVRAALVSLAVAAWLGASAGHASALPSGSGRAALASAGHVVAAGVWAGGLVVLALCVLPLMRREPDLRGPVLATVWRTYSPMAAAASVVLLATGLYEAGRHVPDLGTVTTTVYGGAVAGKVLLVAAALAMAGINTLLVNPGLAARVGGAIGRPAGWAPVSLRRFTTVVAAEALLLAVAVGAAALATSVPTARETVRAGEVTAPHDDHVNGMFITVEAVPAGPDLSRLVVRARSTVLPEPAPVDAVGARLVGPGGGSTSVILREVEPGRYEGEATATAPGDWTATVAVERAGLPDSVTQARWSVADPASARARPLEVATTVLAALLLLVLAGAAGIRGRRRDPPPSPAPPVREGHGSRR